LNEAAGSTLLMDADVCQGVLSQAAQTLSSSLEGSGKAAPKENMRSRLQSGSLTQPLRLMFAKLSVAVVLAFTLEGAACLLSTEFGVLRHTEPAKARTWPFRVQIPSHS
jgi:hypothetical protein